MDALAADKINKGLKVEALVASLAVSATTPHPDLLALRGRDLSATLLSGGLTNYSFKITVKDAPTDRPDRPVFAKLSFPYALWNPDPDQPYDLVRTENEAIMMRRFASLSPGCVAETFACLDIEATDEEPAMKLLVTEWCSADEQFANQWIDGNVDTRTVKPFAKAIAALHAEEVDPFFNEAVRPCLASLWPEFITKYQEYLASDDDTDRFGVALRGAGEARLSFLFEKSLESYNTREGLVHSDLHCFNILVEKKPNPEVWDSFGPRGNFMLCDWEMAFCGPIGRDLGVFLAFPLSCIVSHAANTQISDAYKLLNVAKLFLNTYLDKLDARYDQAATTRSIMGWTGWFLYVYAAMDIHLEFLPVADGTLRFNKVKQAIGVMSLKFLALGFDDTVSYTLSEVRYEFGNIVDAEIMDICSRASFVMGTEARTRRRSSVLRASGLIVSDTPIHHPQRGRFRAVGKAVVAMNRFLTQPFKGGKPQADGNDDDDVEGNKE